MAATAFVIDRREAGQTLAAVLRRRLGLSWSRARQLVDRREVRVGGAVAADAAARVRPGQKVVVGSDAPPKKKASGARQPPDRTHGDRARHQGAHAPRSPEEELPLVYLDDTLVVVDKPAGMTTMRHPDEAAEFGERGSKFLPKTLADRLPRLVGGKVRAVHRIDRDTTGLVVFARTPAAEADLGKQFRAHSVDRRYLALVRGRPAAARVESVLGRDRGDGRRGSVPPETAGPDARRAVTHVRVVEELGDFALVECRLETGRTHQVRIHLGESGCPLCGERVYDRPVNGPPAADGSDLARPALHAAVLGLRHPATGEVMRWESPLPPDMAAALARMRAARDAAGR